jgi:serralysin
LSALRHAYQELSVPTFLETTDAAASLATTYTLGVNQSVQGQLAVGGDHDWYRVNVVAGQTYTFDIVGTGSASHVDTTLTMRDSTGVIFLDPDGDGISNDDGGANTNSRITYTATTTGPIFLDVGGFAAASGQYEVQVSSTTRPAFDLAMTEGALDTGLSWSVRGTGATVTFGFRSTAATYSNADSNIGTFTRLSAAEMAAVRRIAASWSEVAKVTLSEVNPGGYTDSASILVGNYFDPTDGAGAFASLPGTTVSTASAGDVWLNTNSISTTSVPVGSYSYFAILHEFGHALGLSHPGQYNAAPGLAITYANDAQFANDSNQYSVMSYFSETDTGANFGASAYAQTPMLYDIYALQQIYGVNTTTRTGATVYGYNTTAGAAFDASVASSRVFCVWDAGGTDTFDFSGWAGNQNITLVAGDFSSTTGLTNNVSIAYGAVIENAIGGAGNDIIAGNSGANTLTGGAGNDTLDGGAGFDKLLGGDGNDTIVWDANDDLANVLGGAGADVLLINSVAAPTTFGLVAHQFEAARRIQVDNAGNPWTTITENFNTSWQRTDSTTLYDNGLHADTAYDYAATQPYASISDTFDTLNHRTQQLVVYDNATSLRTGYDDLDRVDWTEDGNANGVVTLYRDLDQASNQPWTSYSNYTDAVTGARTQQFMLFDNGTSVRNGYDSVGNVDWAQEYSATNVLTSYRDYDQGTNQPWTYYTNYNDVAGVRTQQYVEFDDGTSLRNAFNASGIVDWAQEFSSANILTSYRDYDQASNETWTYYNNYYDTVGTRTQQYLQFDNGTALRNAFNSAGALDWAQEYYASGVMSSYRDYDQAGQYNWAYFTDTYNTTGQRVSRVTVNDDGTIV